MRTNPSLFSSPLSQAQVLLRLRLLRRRGLRRVSERLFCGSAPSERQLRALVARGVRQVVDLRYAHETDGTEAALCETLGLVYLSVPMGETLPDFPAIERLLVQLAAQPTYVHCQHGCDRTGALVALYRAVVQGWSLPRAGAELLRQGFNPRLEVLAEDICFYSRELLRLQRAQNALVRVDARDQVALLA